MFNLYLFALIFGLLVIIIDLFVAFGGDDDGADPDSGGEDSGGEDSGGEDGGGEDAGDLGGEDQAVVLTHANKGRIVYKLLNLLRLFVYFCVGFGAVGVFGVLTNNPFGKTLIFSSLTGAALIAIVKVISRLQNKVTDSQLKEGELLFAEAEVIVSIAPGKLGKVRVKTGGTYHDLFAKGEDVKKSYGKGSTVYVVDITGSELIINDTK